MNVPAGVSALLVIAAASAIWIFYSVWRKAYRPADEFAWVDQAVDVNDPVVKRINQAVQEDAEVAWLESIPVLDEGWR